MWSKENEEDERKRRGTKENDEGEGKCERINVVEGK